MHFMYGCANGNGLEACLYAKTANSANFDSPNNCHNSQRTPILAMEKQISEKVCANSKLSIRSTAARVDINSRLVWRRLDYNVRLIFCRWSYEYRWSIPIYLQSFFLQTRLDIPRWKPHIISQFQYLGG